MERLTFDGWEDTNAAYCICLREGRKEERHELQ